MGQLKIEGETYTFPIVPEEGKGFAISKNDLYYLKKAQLGDNEAFEVILGDSTRRIFFIGRESPRWLEVTHGKLEVMS